MKRRAVSLSIPLILSLCLALIASLAGCSAMQEAGAALLLPDDTGAHSELITELQADRVEFQKVLDNPDATKADKAIAEKAVPVLDKSIGVLQSNPDGGGVGLIFEILAALGVPGALAGGVIAKRLAARLNLANKAVSQTVDAIQTAYPTGIPTELKTALSSKHDSDVKTLVRSIKTKAA